MPLVDFDSTLFATTQAVLGSTATLTPNGGFEFAVSALDKTAGVEVVSAGDVDVQTIKPAAVLQASAVEGLGIEPGELDGGTLVLNGKTWRIDTHRMLPGPGGEAEGEIMLFLSDTA